MPYKVIKKHTGHLTSTEGNPIAYDLYAPHTDASLSVILFLHGFKGFKDWGTFPDAFDEIARQGFAVLAMNFSRNGVGSNLDQFDRLDLFRAQTISQELEDIKTVVAEINSGRLSKNSGLGDLFPLGVIGHSRGGHTAILAAAEIDEISCLVVWAPVADIIDHLGQDAIDTWKKQQYIIATNSRTGEELEIGPELLNDLLTNRERLSALHRVRELYIPCLFIHGTDDETVHHLSSQKLHEACPSYEKEKYLINGASHTFGSSHPFEGEHFPEHFAELVDQTIKWFQLYLV